MAIKHYLRGAATFVPGAMWITQKRTGGSDTALYCYSVWLRHMSLAHEAGLCTSAPRHVADFGPGDSIGVGLAALLSGAESFIGLDVKPFARAERNLAVFDELVDALPQQGRHSRPRALSAGEAVSARLCLPFPHYQ